MKRILVIDNYDSFTYNLVHELKALGCDVTVKRNDKFEMDEVEAYDKILLSPGPGIPDDAANLKAIIERFAPTKPILGVCLGHQAIGEVFGGELHNLSRVYHGVSTQVSVVDTDEPLFAGLGETLEVARYHSWNVKRELPDCLKATVVDKDGEVMALRHKEYDVVGLQFHPESILTPKGKDMLLNWLNSGNSEQLISESSNTQES